jgi:hypothetical protein
VDEATLTLKDCVELSFDFSSSRIALKASFVFVYKGGLVTYLYILLSYLPIPIGDAESCNVSSLSSLGEGERSLRLLSSPPVPRIFDVDFLAYILHPLPLVWVKTFWIEASGCTVELLRRLCLIFAFRGLLRSFMNLHCYSIWILKLCFFINLFMILVAYEALTLSSFEDLLSIDIDSDSKEELWSEGLAQGVAVADFFTVLDFSPLSSANSSPTFTRPWLSAF